MTLNLSMKKGEYLSNGADLFCVTGTGITTTNLDEGTKKNNNHSAHSSNSNANDDAFTKGTRKTRESGMVVDGDDDIVENFRDV